MQVKDQMVFSCNLGSSVVECGHILVIAVHEVNLEAFYTHLGIMAANSFYVVVECTESGPEDYAHTLILSIGYDFLQIDLGINNHQVFTFSCSPSIIKDNIFDSF